MADYKTKEIPLTGKLQLNGDPAVVGTNFVELKNIRYAEKHLENVSGMTKINSSSLAADVNAAFFFQKDVPTVENNLIIHKGTTLLSNNVVPPNTSNFSTTLFTDSAGAGDPRFSSAPGGKMV